MSVNLNVSAMKYKDPSTGEYTNIVGVYGDSYAEDMIAPKYEDLTFPVTEGQLCIHNNTLYKAKQDISTAEEWSTTHWDKTVISDNLSSGDITVSSEPHNYAFDGKDLSTIFTDADALYEKLAIEDYSNIHVGDYWPVTLNGDYRDYGNMTCPAGTKYYSDEGMTVEAGTTSEDIVVTMTGDANYIGSHKPFNTIKISNVNYYVPWESCLDYQVRTLSNAIMKFEIAGINHYWRYGDTGSDNFHNGKPHIVFSSRDGLPHTLKMRKCNETWENYHVETFTGDGTTAAFTVSKGSIGTMGYVFVDNTKKTYNTDYTFDKVNGVITFKSGKVPASGSTISIEYMDVLSPWEGTALYRTFNDPDYGIIKLIQNADAKLYSHIYEGPNSKGMRYMSENRSKTNQQATQWSDRGLLFLPTEDEIWGRRLYSTGFGVNSDQLQWPIYSNGGRRHFSKGAGNAASRFSVWASSSTSVATFASVHYYGHPSYYSAVNSIVAAPCFLFT